ncbi:hypothetical protein AAG906_004080 [Vitis piasezkii]
MATSSSDSFPIAINATQQITARLTPTNFPSWHAQFESLLLGYNLFGYVDGTYTAHPYRVKRCKRHYSSSPLVPSDKLILSAIRLGVPTVISLIATSQTSYQAWTKPTKAITVPTLSKTIADELALIDAPLSQDDITLYVLHGLGSDFHDIVSNLQFHSEYDGTDEVIIGDGSGLPITHSGSLTLSFPNRKFQVEDTLCVPTINKNLISVHHFTKQNNVILEFHPTYFLVNDREREILLQGPCENGVYPLPSSLLLQLLLSMNAHRAGWHRLGHPSSKVVTRLISSFSLSTTSCLSVLIIVILHVFRPFSQPMALVIIDSPYTPQQNGVSERRHRHIVETGQTLLSHASLPSEYWAYAFATATYLINRLPSPVLHHKSPLQALFKQQPRYEKLHPALVQPQEASLSTSDQVTLRPSTAFSTENPIPSSPPPCPRTIITYSMNNIFRQNNSTPPPSYVGRSDPPSTWDVGTSSSHRRILLGLDLSLKDFINGRSISTSACLQAKKSIYGLKQGPRGTRLFGRHSSALVLFTRHDNSLFIYKSHDILCYCLVYVDDIIVTSNTLSFVNNIINKLGSTFSVKDMGSLHYFLGIEVIPTPQGLFLSQHQYIRDLLSRTSMENAKETLTPMSTTKLTVQDNSNVTSDLGLTRPDIAFDQQLSRFMRADNKPLGAAKDYSDILNDHVSCLNPISWSHTSKGQTQDHLIEFRALARHIETIWLHSLIKELGLTLREAPQMFCDNIGANHFSLNPVQHTWMKHIEIDLLFVRDLVKKGTTHVQHIHTIDQLADLLTKSLSRQRFQLLRSNIGVADGTSILRGI